MHRFILTQFKGMNRTVPTIRFRPEDRSQLFLLHPLSPLRHYVERGTKGRVIRALLRLARALPILTAFLSFENPCVIQAAEGSVISAEVVTHLVGNGTPGPYQLKDHFILEGTEKVRKGGLLLNRDQDYSIDYNVGVITFSFSLSPSDTLRVNYERLNFKLRRKYFRRELVYEGDRHQSTQFSLPGGNSAAGSGRRGGSFLPGKSSSNLMLSGSKTFSLEVGSARDLSLKQGLWLSARGNATRNLEISLQVSDQNMPAAPEGTTKRLEELDKVQILVKSPNFSGILGDYYLEPSESEFSFHEKKLKGVMAEATAGRTSASFALASSKGEYFSNRFSGQENKQGPYQLTGRSNETNVMILPGTERVWVDGEEMQRGSNSDYTIDYSRGTIQFTPRRLITSDSRITVDFEYSKENYRRDFYRGNLVTGFLDGRAKFQAVGIFERDNQSHPSSFSLSSGDKDILNRAGNDRLSASREGATSVGNGMGDYDLAHDSSGSPYYQYVGSDSGAYQVSFSWVGEKKGGYRYKGGGVYQYVYPGNGDYSPIVLLPLPESHSLFDLSLTLFPAEALKTRIEWAGSRRDKNTFSPKDDENNWGDAFSLKSGYQNSDFQFLGRDFRRLELGGEYRLTKKDFAPFGRMDQVEKERRWDLPQESLSAGEETYQFSGMISPVRSFGVDFDFGRLKTKENFTSHRRSLGVEIFPASWISAKGKSENVRSQKITTGDMKTSGEWTKNAVIVNNNVKRLSATLSWEREKRSSSASGSEGEKESFNQLGGKVSLRVTDVIKTASEFLYRQDDRLQEERLDESHSYTWRNRLSARNYGGMLSSDLEFARRIKRYRHVSDNKDRQDLLAARMDFYPPSQLLNLKLYHSQNQIHSARRVDTYLEVEEGRGDYRREDGEYVSHPEGDFVRLSEWVGETRPSIDLNKSLRLIFSPHKFSTADDKKSLWPQLGKILSTDSFINLRGRFVNEKSSAFYFLYPFTHLPDESILSQNIKIRHDLYLLPASRPLNLRLRWEKTEDVDNLISEGGRRESELKQELLLRSCLSSRHSLECRMGKEKIKNDSGNAPRNLIDDKNLKLDFARRQSQVLEVKMSTEYREREERIQGVRAEFFSLSQELSWSPVSQSRLNAQFGWAHLRAMPSGKGLSYVLSEGRRRGENYDWRFFFDYRLNQYLSWTVIYSGESVPDEKAKHTARIEAKAFF
jgi:hypothetical protein